MIIPLDRSANWALPGPRAELKRWLQQLQWVMQNVMDGERHLFTHLPRIFLRKLGAKDHPSKLSTVDFSFQNFVAAKTRATASHLAQQGMTDHQGSWLHRRCTESTLVERHHDRSGALKKSTEHEPDQALLWVFDGKITSHLEHCRTHFGRALSKKIALHCRKPQVPGQGLEAERL